MIYLETCLGLYGQGSCCTKDKPCKEGGGDCDGNIQCAAGLKCLRKSCKYFNKDANPRYNCCVEGYCFSLNANLNIILQISVLEGGMKILAVLRINPATKEREIVTGILTVLKG